MPVQDLWGSFSAGELSGQLMALDAVLLRSPAARARFRERLRQRFPDIPAVVTVVGNNGEDDGHS